MNDSATGFVALVVFAALLGPVLIGAFWVLVLRLGLGGVRQELQRLADEVRTQNEISLDDELRV